MKDKITLIDVKTDNITDYKETSLLLVFPQCIFKCNGCQNKHLMLNNVKTKKFNIKSILKLYEKQDNHKAIVCAGLEPMDTFDDLIEFFKSAIIKSREKNIDFVIYTGYYKDEIKQKITKLLNIYKEYYNENNKLKLIIKYGRYYQYDMSSWQSNILGIKLATNNQYVEQYIIVNRNDENIKIQQIEENHKLLKSSVI